MALNTTKVDSLHPGPGQSSVSVNSSLNVGNLNARGSIASDNLSGQNVVINGGFDIWQRGPSVFVPVSSTNVYTADRWSVTNGPLQSVTVSRQGTQDTTLLPFLQFAARVQRNPGQTGTTPIFFDHSLPTEDSIPLAGQVVTASFYARAGENYSATDNLLSFQLLTGVGIDRNVSTNTIGDGVAISRTVNLTRNWTRYAFTVPQALATSTSQLFLRFGFNPVGTSGVNDSFEITGVEIERGNVATQFRRANSILAAELLSAQRFYYRATAESVFGRIGSGVAILAATAQINIPLPVTMRAQPTVIDFSPVGTLRFVDLTAVTPALTTNPILLAASTRSLAVIQADCTGGMTVNRPHMLEGNNNATAFIGIGAEL
jgi:hypothetical protein